MNSRWAVWILALATALCVYAPGGKAQEASRNEAIYQYKGADREQKLVEAARKEGSLTLYTSLATSESRPLAQAFEEKYGIKVTLWRSTSDKVVQRAVTEARGGRYAVDVVETNGPEMEMLAREKLLAHFESPHIADLPASARPAHGLWVTDRLNFFVVAYNTNLVKKDELPEQYEGFLDPKWQGRIGLEATDVEWMATIIKERGRDKGEAFFRKLAAMRPDVRKGHMLLSEMVGAGEVPVALTVYNSEIESISRRGGPVAWKPVQPVVGRPQGIGVMRNAPSPHAALLFADFVLSHEGQEFFHSVGRIPASESVKTNLKNFPYVMVDPATVLDEHDEWYGLWNELFITR
ncbi:ABC transporter substrate-binding protein [Pusillimonas sp.]|uniref:ABC transporter substrate-binding protein n=1 Tax=Pusillimonas sp. TaxID=3040095 RepID=UPI0029AF497D|nr:extracellular solute-binding protein [Pusillimonas sp.]MDX3894516.1 extracellular solute-binding protein [Pusillimonas sp.]